MAHNRFTVITGWVKELVQYKRHVTNPKFTSFYVGY